jgi:5'-nucleotidase
LQAIDDRITPDPKVQAIADGWRAKAFEAFKQQGFDPATVVATISEPLDGRESTVRNMPGRLTDLIADSMLREAGQADLALFNSGLIRIDDVLRPGPLTQYDVMRVLPLGGAVVKATFDGVLLAQVLDAGMKNQGGGGSLQTAGVTRAGGRWLIGGKPLVPAHRYQVALNDFLLSGSEANLGFLVRTNPHVHDIHELRDVRQALIAELRAKYGK